MPIYTTSYGKRYNIPSDIAAQFEKDFPDAQIRYEASGEEYDIPLKKRDSFLKAYPNAKTVDRISTPPKQDTQPEYSGPGGYFAPKPRHEPNPSALIAEEVEQQQREAGINPNSAEAISQRFDAMIEALPTSATKKYDDQVLREDYRRREEQYNKTHRLGMMQAQNAEWGRPYSQRYGRTEDNTPILPLADAGNQESAFSTNLHPQDYPAPSPEAQQIWERRTNEARAQSQFESGVRKQLWEVSKVVEEQDRKKDEEIRQWREQSHKRALEGKGALPIGPTPPEEARRYSNLKTARGLLDEAVKVIEQADRNTHGATGVGNALRGIKDGLFDPHTWDLGIGELVDANNLRRVIAKSDRNETLTDDERSLLDALATNLAANSLYGSKVGMGYNIGKSIAQSLPFMIEFALNPIAGSSKTIAGKIARYWLKHNIKRKALKKAGARVIGDIAAATGTMATSGSLRTAADAITRMTGNPLYEITPEGKAVYAGHEQGDTPLKAIGKSATAGSIEYYTELLGGAFGPIGRAVGGVLGKVPGMKSITGYLSRSQAAELIRGIRTSDWAKSVGDFTSRTGWHGMVEEYSEEEIGNILNYFTVGDVQKKDLLDPQQHLETFGSVALMGGFFSALKTAGYRPARSRAQKQVAIFDQQAGELLGEEWQNIKAACDNNTDPQSETAALAQVLESSQYNPEQKRAILSYFAAKQSYNGVLLADQKSSEEQTKSPEQTAIENSYDAGYKSVDGDPSAKQAIKQHLNQVSAPFSEERLQELRAVKNPMQYISEHPQEAPQLLEWFKANSTYTGMIEAVQDQIQQKIKESDDAVDSRTHTDGNLYTITLKGDNAAQGYITQGDVAFNPDGSVNKTKSNDRVTVRYADGHSEMLSIDDLGRLVETNNAQELKAQNADAIWEEESRRAAAEIDGTTGPSQGDPITLKDGRRGIFYADTGDGNYLVQLEDGSVIPAPQTAVTLLNRQPSQQEQPSTPEPAQTTPQQTAEQTMAPSPAQEPQNGVDDRIGRSLNKEEADNLIAEMENRAEPAPELELTLENWTAEFGEDGMVDTPIGKVKMGENQYQKLVRNKRENYFGMIKPTLESPDMVLEEADPKEGAERDTKLIFVKTFTKPDGSRVVHFENVTIQKDNLEVSISSHELQKSALQKKMQQDNLLHLKGLFSSEGRLAEPQIEGSDLVPTPSLSSTNEDTTPFAENQIPADQNNTDTSSEATQTPTEVTYPRDEKTGHILFDQIDDPTVVAAALRNEFGEQALEAAQTKLQDLQGELEKAASTKDTFERLYKQRDLQREIAKYQQVVSTLTPTEVEQITPQEMNRAEVQPENVQNETNRSEQQGQETTNADTQTTNADQSEVDENGRPFVKASDGSTVFGEITEDTGLTPAPIKLSEGVITNTTTNDGYGLAHIEARHGDQIRQAGFDSVEEFVESVAKNYDQIKEGRKRNDGSETYLLQLEDKHNNTLFVELSKDGSYWNINSAGIFNNKYARGNKVVYSRHTQTNQFAETGEGSPSTEQSGTQSDASTLPPTSANEDTTNIQENQESASKNTENQTNPPTNKTNTPILPKKQTAPKYAKEIAQFGDEVSIEDVVLRDIALGQKFSWEDHGKSRGIASELGFTGKEAERRSRISMLRNDGITVDDYVHGLWQEYGERFRQDDAHIRDAVLDVLQRVYSPKAAMEQLRNLHAQEEFSQEEQNILTPEEQDAFGNAPVSEYAFREPEATTPEEQQIIDQAKQNGTYMKAPNGKPTNLTAAQWVKVRTQAFKNWFGDWEKIAKLANSKHKGNERNRSKQAPEYTDDFRRVQARSRKLSQDIISEYHRSHRSLNDSERRVLSEVLRRQLLSARTRGRYAQRTLIDPKHKKPVPILENVDGQLFHDIFEIVRNYLPNGELVDLHENYDNATCYLAADGLSGFAVEDNGNLVSVFSLNPDISFLWTIKDYVTECGATHLDGYNSPKQPLAKIYQKTLGWKVASLMDYNMEFDHDDIAANHDAPQVAFMVNSSQDVETKSFDKDSYDEAEAYQQEQVKAIFENCSKVIDENGEPLAVYPVPSSTNTTDEGAGNDQQTGLYFETGGNGTGDRSRQAYFLNIRDPKYSSTQGDLSNTSHDGAILQSQQPGETSSATTYAVAKADQIQPATDLNEERSSDNPDTRYRNIDEVNDQFNAELQQQIEGTLPKGHIYQLGHPSEALQAAGIPNLPIELAASRLSNKSMQANHPFELSEIENLPEAIQQPLAVFRSATHIGSYVVMTEIEHQGKNYVAAIQTHRKKGSLEINDIRSIYPKNNGQIANWIDEGLLEYAETQKMVEWLSKQRSNSAEVRKLFNHATNIVNSFENPTLTDGKKVATAEELSETLHTPIRIVRNVNDIHDDEKEALRKRRAYGWYDMETGEVVIVLPNCRDEAEVQATILHEVVGHKGLRELVGEEKYNDLLRRVWSSLDPATKAKKQKQYGHPLIAADEYLASLAEENVEPNVLKRILAQVRNWLREVLGMDIKLSDNDLRYLLWRSKHNLQNKQNIFERAETAAKDAELRYRLGINNQAQDQTENSGSTELDAVNRRFNEQLETLTEKNADSTVLQLGRPSDILRAAGIADKPLKLYGSKVIKKMKKHGFKLEELQNLPEAVANPIAVFNNYQKEGNRSILTELKTTNGNFLVSLDLGKGEDVDFNIISSVFGKGTENIQDWINQGYTTYINKEKALNYLHHPALYAGNLSSQELSLATNIIKNFENPTLPSEENIRFRENGNELDAVNRRFNEKLETLTEKNADSTVLQLGRPSDILRAAGIADKPLKLYGSKVIKKMKKHGFKLEELQNLPEAVANPIAVFNNYQKEGNRSILTELKTTNGNFLVSLDLGKGEDVDFNIISSVFGKGTENIQDWINQGYTTYINKEKALNYLHHPALYAGNLSSQELSLATNIIKNFENPTLPSEENIRFREKEAPGDLPTSQASSSQEKLREELKHLRTLRKGLDSEVMQYRKRGAQNESSSTRQLKDIIARYNRSQRQIREYVNDILDAQAATTLGKREINTLLSALVRATDPQKAEQAVHRILDTVTTARLRAETARTEKLYSTKIQGETPQGVPEAKGVDDNTRVMIEYFRAHKEENINELEEALRTKEATEGLTPAEQMHMDAIYLIRLYQQATEVGNDYMAASAQMEQLEQQIDTLSKEVWHLQRAKATGGEARRKRTIEQKQQTMVQKGHLLEATRWQLQELKQNYLEQLQGFNDILQEVILNGRSAYLDWVHKQQDRQRKILQGAFADAGPKAMASARQYGGWKPQGPLHKSVLAMRDFFTAPLLSLDYLIRKHTQSAPNGEGHLYNQFIRGEGGYMEASNRYFERTREITDALGEAAQRYMGISGKNMGQRWLRAQAQARRSPLTFSLQLNDGSRPQVISATQALYLRALEKQTDGQVKLRAMGISEEVMEQISQTLQQEAPEMVALADWVQEQLLPSLRESYNATHLRLFGTQMREVAHYFPISINKRETYRENDGTEHEQTLPTTTTGSIISRKPNTTAIDWNMDFFEVLDRHIQQMEHWNAYSEVVQNMNRLTSNTLFKKSLEYKNPGEARKFMDAARVAAEQYRIQVLDHESVIVKLSQAAASSKINFRVWTAIKQIASSPAFVAYSADPQFWATLSKHVATLPATLLGRGDYSWAKANLPDFRRRVQGGTAGNDALERESFSVVRKLSKDPRSPLSYGMWANAHMDAVVCAMGAKAVYEYQLSRHKRRGLSESEAQRAARRDAELSYNLSQQSALGVNLSPMQRSRNFFSVIFSTFQNAQFLYGRQLGDALRELTRSTELETEALYQRYRTRGMESTQARRAALKDVSIAKRTSVVRILTYGWGLQLLWVAMSNALPYIFGGDDDDKNLWVESAKNPAVWIGPLQGLFGGGNLTSIAEGYPFGGPMLFEDISRFWRNYGEAAQSQGIFSWETAGVTLDLLTEFSLSQNSETFMNLYNGVQAFIDGHSTAGLLQLLNAPRSQIKKILMQRGEHESLMQYAERINNLQELFRAMDRSAQGAQDTSYPLYEELEQAN